MTRPISEPAGVGIFVIGTLPGDVASVVATVADLGIGDPGTAVHAIDSEIRVALRDSSGARADLAELMVRARRSLPAGPWVLGSTGPWLTTPVWREAWAGAALAVVVNSPAPAVLQHLAAGGQRTAAVAAALWERSTRQALHAADGLPAVVVRTAHATEIVRFLGGCGLPVGGAGHGGNRGEQPGSSRPSPAGPSPARPVPMPRLSSGPARLQALVDGLEGSHRRFSGPELAPESPSTPVLVEADGCFERERIRLETCASLALRAVEGVTPPVPPAPPPFESGYGLDAAEDGDGYRRWIARQACRSPSPGTGPAEGPAAGPGGGRHDLPAIGVVVAADRADPALLMRTLASVVAQTHAAWELCVGQAGAGPAGPDARIRHMVSRLASQDPRVRAGPVEEGTVAATNAAAGLVRSPFLAFLGPHDELTPTALAVVAEALAADPEIDVLYTDEDEVDDQGTRRRPRFKPDWSPDLLLSTMYVGQLLVVRRRLIEEVGGLRPELAGSEYFDLALRVTERARRIEHVAQVCFHRRAGPDAYGGTGRDRAGTDRAALESALRRRGEQAAVEPGLCDGTHRVRRAIVSAPLVSILVPFRDGSELLRKCIASLHRTSGYDRWELVLIDNQSWEPETVAMLRRLESDPKCRVVAFPHPYNWSALNNFGAAQANGELLLFLNSDVEGRSEGWLAAMVEHAQSPDVGAVGARLLYADGRVQHAGVVIDLARTVSWHAFWKCPGDGDGYLGYAKTIRNYSAVTGACMLVRRDVFDAVGGMDETLAICFNDVELCLRMRAAGKRVVYTPFAELFHYESSTRGVALEQEEIDMMRRRWGDVITDDPYFNPNLDRNRSEFSLPR